MRLVLDKLTNQKFGNDPLRMVIASSIVHVKEEDNGWSNAKSRIKNNFESVCYAIVCITIENSPRPRVFRRGYVNTEKGLY